MNHGITTVIYPVKDLEQAKALYGKLLGKAPYADAPYYVAGSSVTVRCHKINASTVLCDVIKSLKVCV